MTQQFRDLFDEVADFYFLEAPHSINPSIIPPEPALIKLGFQAPFKAWFAPIPISHKRVEKELADYISTHEPLPEGLKYNIFTGIDTSIDFIVDVIKKDGPFDGVLSFSQGSAMFRVLNAVTQLIRPNLY